MDNKEKGSVVGAAVMLGGVLFLLALMFAAFTYRF